MNKELFNQLCEIGTKYGFHDFKDERDDDEFNSFTFLWQGFEFWIYYDNTVVHQMNELDDRIYAEIESIRNDSECIDSELYIWAHQYLSVLDKFYNELHKVWFG